MEGAVTGARGSLGQGGQVPQLAETWICRSEHVCKWSSPPFTCANCLSACPQEGGKGKERGNSKFSWLFAGSSGQRFAVEEDEISDENTTAFHRSSTVSAVFSSNPFPQWRGSPQRLCVIRQVRFALLYMHWLQVSPLPDIPCRHGDVLQVLPCLLR